MMNFIISENKKMMDSINSSINGIDTKLDKINLDFNQMKTDVNNLVDKVDNHVDTSKKKFEEYDLKLHSLSIQNSKMKSYLDNLERIRRLVDISIDGVPNLPATTDVKVFIENMCNYLGVEINNNDIISCYRTKRNVNDKSNNSIVVKPASIIAKFSSTAIRDKIIDQYFSKNATLKLSDICSDLNISTRVYLGDHLTNSMQSVSRKCMALKKHGKIKKYYSRKGFIYIISNDAEKTSTKISSVIDLDIFMDTLNLSQGSTSTTI